MKAPTQSDKEVSENSGSRDNCPGVLPKVGCSHHHCQQARIICPQNPNGQAWTGSGPGPPKPWEHKQRAAVMGQPLSTDRQKILPPFQQKVSVSPGCGPGLGLSTR